MSETLFEKMWKRHIVAEGAGGRSLLYIDRHILHEGSFNAFEQLQCWGRSPRRPKATFATADHYAPTRLAPGDPMNPEAKAKVEGLAVNSGKFGITHFGMDDPRRGIVHVIGPEQGITQPGMTLVCGDSHTGTHGALGALALPIGASEVAHVLATQTLWQKRPKTMRINVTGRLASGVAAKDLILGIIARIGVNGGSGYAVEYAGEAIRALTVEERLTVCNMSIEAGARCGMVAPDETIFAYLHGRPYAPQGADWERALRFWRTLPTDPDASFDREVTLDATGIEPMVTWGTSLQDCAPVSGRVPDPAHAPSAETRAAIQRGLEYMDLAPGTPLSALHIDRVFIGSCTNSRVEDLRAAAAVLRGRRAVVPAMVSPGSGLVKQAAEAEGLHRIFLEAGFEWRDAGCSMCVGMNGDLGRTGERIASTSNRNFEGRQGKGVRTHLMSPAMAAAAAVTGRVTDVRTLR